MKQQRPLLGEPPAGFDEDQLKYPDPPETDYEHEWLLEQQAQRRATAVYYSNPLVSADMIEEALKDGVKPWQFVQLSPIVHSWLEEGQENEVLPGGVVAHPLLRIQELARLLVLIGAER